ncbi:phospholipase B [Cavenderia fasciculata]|uniref:Phospholipase B-like n=1 Tax=Cavenderia fasciculata TaxID=261658 RepID=F4PJJ8_CACFS|nr:phospholipase B [Cavenderia fasciculata]EGG23772.1 phospholipase B [Cavenderia fasciculata]|eukprot:XP_004361623.1 phospholipase B [Cavenderia fasciculata]
MKLLFSILISILLLLSLVHNDNIAVNAKKHHSRKHDKNSDQHELLKQELVDKKLSASFQTYTVFSDSANGYRVVNGNQTGGIATAIYSNQMETTGWGYLSVETSSNFPDLVQASAAGYLEGYITSDMIYQNWYNMYVNEYKSFISDAVVNWVSSNIKYMVQEIQNNPNDPFWVNVNLIYTQTLSLVQGYQAANQDPNQDLQLIEFMLMNMDGDMIDLAPALNISFTNFLRKTGHCSSLVKLSDDLTDLYSGHTTWSSYYEMVRMFKIYTFSFSDAAEAASRTTMFSSYPASLSSIDDFYLLDTRIVVMETTNGLMNNNLYPLITTSSVLSWIRVVIANRMATDGNTWCQVFSIQNSGTYNNQWIVVDYNRFQPGYDVKDGMVYILEQIPEYIEYDDVTNLVRTGYWPSFNIPYFENIYNMSGFNETGPQFGNFFSYAANPRGMIFRRDANNVDSFKAFKAQLRYNDWKKDPLSLGNPGNAISSRFDLVTKNSSNPYLNRDAFGGIDSKVVSLKHVDSMLVAAQSGPSHDQQDPFDWKKGDWSYTHVGMPDKWDFDWMTMSQQSMAIDRN